MATGSDNKKTRTQKTDEKLRTNPYQYESLVFPEDLGAKERGLGHYVLFNINTAQGVRYGATNAEQNATGTPVGTSLTNQRGNIVTQGARGRSESTPAASNVKIKGGTTRIKTSVALQMPISALTAQYQANWDSAELGAAAGAKLRGVSAAEAFNNADSNRGGIQGTIDGISAAGSQFLGDDVSKTILTTLTPQEVEDVFILAPDRLAKNPRVEVLFRNIANRTFQFQFRLAPSSASEAATLKKIVETFKFAMAPRLRSNKGLGGFFEYPDEFDINFYMVDSRGVTRPNDNIHRISTCALTSFNVDYSASGNFATFEDGQPVEIIIDMQFTELELMHKDRILEGF